MGSGIRTFEMAGILVVVVGVGLGAWTITEYVPPVSGVALSSAAGASLSVMRGSEPLELAQFIEVMDGCGIHYEGACTVARTSPASTSPEVLRLRKGMVLEVATTTIRNADGEWHKVVFREWIRYPARLNDEWYVKTSEHVRPFHDAGVSELTHDSQQAGTTTKHIVIDRSEQKLYAYDGDVLFFATPISTGLDLTPTPRGTFVVYKKTPTRYMQGPLPGISDQYYDLPGVPWDLYFTDEGGAIHGAYWHESFGSVWSHGCVNLPLIGARTLYYWTPVGTPVTVQD